MLAQSKVNSIESKIPEALKGNGITHEGLMTAINKKKTIENEKKVLEWGIVKDVVLMKLLNAMSLLMSLINNEFIKQFKISNIKQCYLIF